MRAFISVDMEGVAGIATIDQVVRGGSGYPRAQELMTEEANAAIRGAFAGGAAEVLVNDSHGTMDNLLHDRLDPRARVVFGAPRPSCMVQGITRDDDLAVFVRERLADYKVPRSWELVDELPRDPNGKVLKRLLRDAHWSGTQTKI